MASSLFSASDRFCKPLVALYASFCKRTCPQRMHVQLHSTSDKFSSDIAGILSGKLGIFGHPRELAEVTHRVIS